MANLIQSFNGIYCVEQYNSNGEIVDWSVAIRPLVDQAKQRVTWQDGGRGRLVDYSKLKDLQVEYSKSGEAIDPEILSKMTIKDSTNARRFVLKPLTLESYNELIRLRLSGHPEFESEKEMKEFFLKLDTEE